VPPSFDVTALVVLTSVPGAIPLTLTENVQEALEGSVAVASVTLADPATAVIVPPPQLPVSPLGVATTRPAGIVSVNPIPVSVVLPLGFVRLKVSEVVPFSGIDAAPKTLLNVGGPTTVMLAFDVFPVPPLVEETVTELFLTPAVVPVTFTKKVQELLIPSVAPERLTLEEAAVAVIVPPPHAPVSPFGVATTTPAGRLSVKATPVSAMLALGLLTVKVNFVFWFTPMLEAPKALVIVGGVPTVRFAVAVLPVPPFVELTAPEVFV
jgi:hypothetical protein